MLAHPEMDVVIVMAETITPCTLTGDGRVSGSCES